MGFTVVPETGILFSPSLIRLTNLFPQNNNDSNNKKFRSLVFRFVILGSKPRRERVEMFFLISSSLDFQNLKEMTSGNCQK